MRRPPNASPIGRIAPTTFTSSANTLGQRETVSATGMAFTIAAN